MTLGLGLLGAVGRMGQVFIEAAAADSDVALVAAAVRPSHGRAGTSLFLGEGGDGPITLSDKAKSVFAKSDVVVDFTLAGAARQHAELAAQSGTPLIIGTTGLDSDAKKAIIKAAKKTAILYAPNMSLGINLVLSLAEQAARILGDEFDIEITDAHHAMKLDAPSGTALAIGEAAAKGRGKSLDDLRITRPDGVGDARLPGGIGFSSLRGGDIVGEHSILFAGPDERIEISHKAGDRRLFAKGALVASKWIEGQPAGLYSMKDVLGL